MSPLLVALWGLSVLHCKLGGCGRRADVVDDQSSMSSLGKGLGELPAGGWALVTAKASWSFMPPLWGQQSVT